MLEDAPSHMLAERPLAGSAAPRPVTTTTTCPYCGVGCGVLATPDGAGGASVAGDPAHPANFGRLCSKGSALDETLTLEGRLLHPMTRGADGHLRRAGWNEALARVAGEFTPHHRACTDRTRSRSISRDNWSRRIITSPTS